MGVAGSGDIDGGEYGWAWWGLTRRAAHAFPAVRPCLPSHYCDSRTKLSLEEHTILKLFLKTFSFAIWQFFLEASTT